MRLRTAHGLAALTLAAGLGGAWMLRAFPPGTAGIYPACPFHQFTGLLCPGCGTTRALAALVRGDLPTALEANALTTLLLPFLLAWGMWVYLRKLRGQKSPVQPPRPVVFALLAVASLFMIFRNL